MLAKFYSPNEHVCESTCLSVCRKHISETTWPNLAKFTAHVAVWLYSVVIL